MMSDRPAAAHSLVIFDCDGVLIDSEILACDVLIAELGREGIIVDRDYVFHNFIGHSFPVVAQRIRGLTGKDLTEGFEARYRASLGNVFDLSLKPTSGVTGILEQLGAAYCVATSSSVERAARSLAAAGLAHLAKPVFTASMVAHGKPAPDLFLFAAERMRVAPRECLVIEDSIPGVLAARAAGMAVWRFAGGSHFRFGFGKDDPPIADGSLARWDQFFAVFPHLYRDR